jgi:hypothetical protein
VNPASPGATRQPRRDDLLRGIAELAQVPQQLVRADRRVAEAEAPDDLLVEPLLGEDLASRIRGSGVPEVGLEELAGIGEYLLDPVLRDVSLQRVLPRGDPRIVSDGVNRRVSPRIADRRVRDA